MITRSELQLSPDSLELRLESDSPLLESILKKKTQFDNREKVSKNWIKK